MLDISNIRTFKCSDFQMSEFFHFFNSSQTRHFSFTAKLKLIFLPHICFILDFRIKSKQNYLPLPFEYRVIKFWSYLSSLHTTSTFFDKTSKKYDSEITISKRFSDFRPVNRVPYSRASGKHTYRELVEFLLIRFSMHTQRGSRNAK